MLELTDPRTHDWSRPTVDHVHVRVADLARSRTFYRTVLEPLGIRSSWTCRTCWRSATSR